MYSYDYFVRLFAISCYFLCLFYSNVLTLCHLAGITMNVDVADNGDNVNVDNLVTIAYAEGAEDPTNSRQE